MHQPALITEAQPSIEFSVAGAPLPQGSKTGYIRGGSVVLVDLADKKTKKRPAGSLKAYRGRVAAAARLAMTGDLWLGPILLECEFVLPRAKSHYTSKGNLTKSAPTIPQNDLDKLVRAVGDALTDVVYRDDVQIVGFGKTTKRFATSLAAVGGVHVKVTKL